MKLSLKTLMISAGLLFAAGASATSMNQINTAELMASLGKGEANKPAAFVNIWACYTTPIGGGRGVYYKGSPSNSREFVYAMSMRQCQAYNPGKTCTADCRYGPY